MTKATFNNRLSRIALAALTAAVLLAGVAIVGLSGPAAAEEIGNETVTIQNGTTDVLVETTWNDSIGDTADTTASVEIVDVDDNTTAHSVEISGSESTTISREINVSDAGLEAGTEYRVTVDGESGVLDETSIGTLGSGGLIGGVAEGIDPIHWVVGVVLVALAILGVVRFTEIND